MTPMNATDDIPLMLVRFVLVVFILTTKCAAQAWMALQGGDNTAASDGRLSMNPLVHADPLGTFLLPGLSAYWGFPLLCWAKPVPVAPHRLKSSAYMMWVALAAPAACLILAIWSLPAMRYIFAEWLAVIRMEPDAATSWESLLKLGYYFLLISVAFATFDLLPLPGFAGGVVMERLVIRHFPALHAPWDALAQIVPYLLLAALFIEPIREATFGRYFGLIAQQVQALIL